MSIQSNVVPPFVSIVVPTRNRRRFIPQLLRNFRLQTYPVDRMELIVFDDGDDPVSDLLIGESGVTYIRSRQRLSIGAKRNYLNRVAKGEIIVNMDDDDYYPPSRVSHAVEMLLASGKLIAGSSEMFFYFVKEKVICKKGPYGPNHGTAGTYAYRKEYVSKYAYKERVSHAEEAMFTNNFRNPMVQLNSREAIMVIVHSSNTYPKQMSEPLSSRLSDFVEDEASLRFYEDLGVESSVHVNGL